jgi:hypothetical protein
VARGRFTEEKTQEDVAGTWLSVESVVHMLRCSSNLDECDEAELRAHVLSWVEYQRGDLSSAADASSSGRSPSTRPDHHGPSATASNGSALWSPARKVGVLSVLVHLEHGAQEVKFDQSALMYSSSFGLIERNGGSWRRARNWRVTPEGKALLRKFHLT